MSRRYSFESEPDEQAPLDDRLSYSPRRRQRYQPAFEQQQHIELADHEPYYDEPASAAVYDYQQQQQLQQPQVPQPRQQQYYPPSSSRPLRNPGTHPDSAYQRLAANRQYALAGAAGAPLRPGYAADAIAAEQPPDVIASASPPRPPPHRGLAQPPQSQPSPSARVPAYPQAVPAPQANVTPGADNFSESAAGGMAGIAYSVAERNPRESGLEAMRGLQQPQSEDYPPTQTQALPPGYPQQTYHGGPQQYGNYRRYSSHSGPAYEEPEPAQEPPHMRRPAASAGAAGGPSPDRGSRSSLQGLGGAAFTPGSGTPGTQTPHSFAADVYTDDPYGRYAMQDAQLGYVNPNEIEDDGDDGLEYSRSRSGPARTSMLSLGGHSTRSGRSGAASGGVVGPAAVGAAAIGAAAAGTAASAVLAHDAVGGGGGHGHALPLAGAVGHRVASSKGAQYSALYSGGGGGGGGSGSGSGGVIGGGSGGRYEKSEWLAQQSNKSKRWKWVIFLCIALAIVAGVVCGVVFGVVLKKKSGGSKGGSSGTAASDTAANGDLGINSPEIQKLLNNKNLHKVFPGIDYTPINTQYPDCLTNPPSQNNVTRDVAVLSQLTNTIRLYGTDCNQTEMTIHAIERLQMSDTVKIWMGVWQDGNKTTNARQLAQMWNILDTYGSDPFKGIIVANEILFRQQMTTSQLATLLSSVRTNLTSMNIDLPVATSDLGTVWDAELAEASDYVMANIHPFFGGVNAKSASAWTWNFWETNNGPFFKTDKSKNIISETGWPSAGGTDCGTGSTETSCPDAAVAGITEINTFLSSWVCDALTNGTEYFWFEAFDEPWKIMYDSGDQNWEDHWGIMDVNRNLKPGITIPDCGGKTV